MKHKFIKCARSPTQFDATPRQNRSAAPRTPPQSRRRGRVQRGQDTVDGDFFGRARYLGASTFALKLCLGTITTGAR
eukprot:6020934-Prymnesium_polylepis.1